QSLSVGRIGILRRSVDSAPRQSQARYAWNIPLHAGIEQCTGYTNSAIAIGQAAHRIQLFGVQERHTAQQAQSAPRLAVHHQLRPAIALLAINAIFSVGVDESGGFVRRKQSQTAAELAAVILNPDFLLFGLE